MSSIPSVSQILLGLVEPQPMRNQQPLEATGRAGRNLPAAVTTAVVLVALLALSLAFNPVFFIGFIAIMVVIAIWELGGALARVGVSIALPPLFIGGIGMVVSAYTLGAEALLAALFLTVMAAGLWRLAESRDRSQLRDIMGSAFVALYLPFFASFIALILSEHNSIGAVVMLFTLTTLSDTGGWCAGVLAGKHPMAPRLSPKKSWEGFAGSVVATAVGAMAFYHFFEVHWAWGIVTGVAVALTSTIGDLTESLIKREVGLKDMSQILPGHGGVLDRVDSIVMTAPVLHFIFLLTLGM